MIYISHPYGGKEENKLKVEEVIKKLVVENPSETYISPIHCFGFMYELVDYQSGLEMCLRLLESCDKMLVFGDWQNSRGCNAEILHAGFNHIQYEIVDKLEVAE
jgi:cell division FtsZ-interacting protein ZapD